MWLAYIDESGNTGRKLDDPDQPMHWMVSVLVPEDRAIALSLAMDGVVTSVPGRPRDTELHGNELFSGDGAWSKVAPAERVRVYEQALSLLAQHDCVVAHSSIDKTKLTGSNSVATSPHVMAFQFLIEKLNAFVRRNQDPLRNRVLLVADETDEHGAFQIELVREMQRSFGGVGLGGALTNVVDTVHFVDSRTNRGVQLADLVAYALSRSRRKRQTENRTMGDDALISMYDTHVSPLVRTYRSTWPS